MSNPRPLTYTDRISVALTALQREQLRRYADAHGTAMSIVMREAALAAIGRADLSLADETEFPVGGMLHRQHARPLRRLGATVVINITGEQRKALERAALAEGIAVSHLVRRAGLLKAGIAPAKPRPVGRPIGH